MRSRIGHDRVDHGVGCSLISYGGLGCLTSTREPCNRLDSIPVDTGEVKQNNAAQCGNHRSVERMKDTKEESHDTNYSRGTRH
jgi:hypothetical protein